MYFIFFNPGGCCDYRRLYVVKKVRFTDQNSSPNFTTMFIYVRNRSHYFLYVYVKGHVSYSSKIEVILGPSYSDTLSCLSQATLEMPASSSIASNLWQNNIKLYNVNLYCVFSFIILIFSVTHFLPVNHEIKHQLFSVYKYYLLKYTSIAQFFPLIH